MKHSFAQRLKQACDDNELVPTYGHGRQAHLAQQLDVSQEAVRKWFTGEAIPRREKIKALAEVLRVEESWLALGIEPEVDRKTKRALGARTDGAIYVVYGLLTMAGGVCAFPAENDPRRRYVDMYAIVGGRQQAIHVSVGRETGKDDYEFVLPREYDEARCLGVIHRGGMRFQLLEFASGSVQKHADKKSGGALLHVSRVANKYQTGSTNWPAIEDVRDIA